MNSGKKLVFSILAAVLIILTGVAVAQDGPDPDYSIDWYTMDGGGGTSSGGAFSLTGTIGQFDASVEEATGGVYGLSGGFWGIGRSGHLFKDGFEL